MAYVSIVPYADQTFADAYAAERMNSSAWTSASNADKLIALKNATRYLDTLWFVGEKTDVDQAREFPRNGDTEIPYEVQEACCETAIELLEGNSVKKMQGDSNLASESTGDASASYVGSRNQLDENRGVISPAVLALLVPWLKDSEIIRIDRVS